MANAQGAMIGSLINQATGTISGGSGGAGVSGDGTNSKSALAERAAKTTTNEEPNQSSSWPLSSSLFDSRVHKSYGQKIADGRYIPPGMTAPLAIKDFGLH